MIVATGQRRRNCQHGTSESISLEINVLRAAAEQGQKNAAAKAAALFQNAGLELDPNAQLQLSG